MTEATTPYPKNATAAVDMVNALVSDLRVAKANVAMIQKQIADVKLALRHALSTGKTPRAPRKPRAADAPSRRRGMPKPKPAAVAQREEAAEDER
jgi:hypothetical protein